MKATFLKFAFLFLLLEFSTSHLFALSGFVSRQGTNFILSGKPLFFAGANCYDLFTYGNGSSTGSSNDIENSYMSKSAIDTQMGRMQADGVTVVRTWGFNHQGTWHVFEPSKGTYNEPEFREFDYILNSASNHNIRVIVALENYWSDYGGIDTRLTWEGLAGGDPGRRKFFTNTPAIQGYKNYVQYFLNRTNHYTGTQYKNDQTIFAWEVMNEPRYQGESSAENAAGTKLRAWMDNVGSFIKSIDTNHMLGTGMEGLGTAYGYGGNVGAPFVYVQQSTNIDFCSAHVYPANSSLTIAQTTNLIIAWAHDAHVTVGKPFFLGEFNVSSSTRSNYWVAIYQTIQAQNIGGSAFWWYEEDNIDGTYGVQQGAPELAIFSAHSQVMQAKSGGVSILGSFGGGLHGYYPNGLVRGGDGRLYGTTQDGGTNDLGTVFVVDTNGLPVELYSFVGAGDGAYPYAALIQGADGNFYGTAPGGGTNGSGTVFRMTTNGAVSGVYSFTGGSDGASPYAGLVQATDGSLFGVTYYGGAYGVGTVFKVSTNGVFNLLHQFTGGVDGAYADAALVQGADGNFYGAASGGGMFGNGTVFRLEADGSVTTLYSFTGGSDGYSPDAAMVQGIDGNFYGVTSYGGIAIPNGTVFGITTGGVLTTLHAFAGGSDGATPYGGLLQLADGSLYGATASGGPYNDGTVFRITPGGTLTNLAWFNGYNGANPQSALVQGSDGALYGTTLNGGVNGNGTIFRVTVPVPPVGSVTTTLGLATSGSPSAYGNPVTFTATIRTNGTAVENISGETVTFYDGAAALGTRTLNGSGQAAYLTGASQLSAATHSVTAVYGGDATYVGSTNSPALSQTVYKAMLTVSGVTAANKAYEGTAVATLLGTPALVGVVSNEDVSLSTGTVTASFADPAVGFGKPVAVSGYSLLGTAVGNYTLVQPTGLTADILPSTAPMFVGQGISKDSEGWNLNFSGPAGQTYTVLTTSDLTLPIDQWTTLTTGTFGSGAVLFIDGSNTQPARFYLISP